MFIKIKKLFKEHKNSKSEPKRLALIWNASQRFNSNQIYRFASNVKATRKTVYVI